MTLVAVVVGTVVYAAVGVWVLWRMQRAGFRGWWWGYLAGGWPVYFFCQGIASFLEET